MRSGAKPRCTSGRSETKSRCTSGRSETKDIGRLAEEKIKNTIFVLMFFCSFVLMFSMGCAATEMKILYPEPANDAQKLANYVVEKGEKDPDCKWGEKCRKLVLNDVDESDGFTLIAKAEFKVKVKKNERKLMIHGDASLINGDQGWQVIFDFTDKNIDARMDYIQYIVLDIEQGNEHVIVDIVYKDGKVYKNESGEWVDASLEVEAALQKYYQETLVNFLDDFKWRFK